MQTIKTFYLLPYHVERLKDKVWAINKRAKKLGLPLSEIKIYPFEDSEIKVNESGSFDRKFKVDLLGHEIVLSGWTVQGVITNLATGSAILAGNVPELYRARGRACDHCKTNRKRIKTVILKNEQGETIQVGRSCLKDFLGHANPEMYADYWAELTSLDLPDIDETESGGERSQRIPALYDTHIILGLSAALIRKYGFISKRKAEDNGLISTASDLRGILWKRKAEDHITDEDLQLVPFVLVWARAQDGQGGYLGNVAAVLSGPLVDAKGLGIACSAVAAYQRATSEAETKDQAPSEYFGEVKKRETFKLKVMRSFISSGYYGDSTVIIFADKKGNRAIWFASGYVSIPDDAKRDFYPCKATVKAHQTYRDEKQTVLTRLKW